MKTNDAFKQEYTNVIDRLELSEEQKSFLKLSWLDYLMLLNKKAGVGWFRSSLAQIVAVTISLIIPVIETSNLNQDILDLNLSVVSVLALGVAIITTWNRQLGYEEKWRHYRRNTEMIRNEGDDFFALSGNYEKYSRHTDAFKSFATALTSFKRQEVNTYFEQSAPKRQNPNPTQTQPG